MTRPLFLILPILLATLPLLIGLTDLSLYRPGDLRPGMRVTLLPVFQISVILLAVLTGLSARSRLIRLNRWQMLALIGFAAVAVAGAALNAPLPLRALIGLFNLLLHALVAICLLHLFTITKQTLRPWMLVAFCLTFLIHLPLLAIVYAQFFGDPGFNWKSGPMGFWHVRVWGMMLAGAAGAWIGLLLMSRDRSLTLRLATLCLGVLIWALLFWSGTRGGVVSVVAAVALGAILFKPMRRTVPEAALVLVLGLGLSLMVPPPSSSYGIANSVAETTAATTTDGVSAGRLTMWRTTFDYAMHHPLIGNGYDQMIALDMGRFAGFAQPHNSVMDMLLSFGVLGTVCLAALLLSLWWTVTSRQMKAPDPVGLGAITGLNALIVFSLFDGTLYHQDPLMAVSLFIALALGHGLSGQSDPA